MMTDRSDPDRLLDLLADHDAGLPVDPGVLDDPRARRMLDALAATRAELAALPPTSPPPGIVARWNAALTATDDDAGHPPSPRHSPTAPPLLDHPSPGGGTSGASIGRSEHRPPAGGPVAPGTTAGGPGRGPSGHRPARGATPGPRGPSSSTARPVDRREPSPPGSRRVGPGRRGRPRPAVVAGLVLAVVLVVAGLVTTRTAPPSITAAQLGGIARAAVGVQDAGALADPVRRAACLRAVFPPGPAAEAPLVGSRTVVFEGHPGVILLLITGKLGVLRAVVVDPGCGAGGGALLADTLVGG